MTTEASIDYDALHQEALRGLVRSVLVDVAKTGLPGDHHFYISYDVRAPGVALSKRLREKYPTEMTIVLQHRFWDLAVSEERFEVKLTFDGIPERLVVPFAAIKVFIDPSAKFVLQFEGEGQVDGPEAAGDIEGRAARKRSTRSQKQRVDRPTVPATLHQVPTSPSTERPPSSPRQKPAALPAIAPPPAAGASETGREAEKTAVPPPPGSAGGAQVVSLDAFRKK